MRRLTIYGLVLSITFSCNQNSKKGTELGDNQQIMVDITSKQPFSPLIEGEVLIKMTPLAI